MKLFKVLLILVPLLLVAVIVDAMLMSATGGARIFDPFLVVVVSQAPHGRKTDAMVTGALAGLVQDLLASIVFGMHFLSKVVVGYGASLLSGRLIPGQPLTAVVLLAGGTLVEAVVHPLAGALLGRSIITPDLLTLGLSVLLNVAIGLPALTLIDIISRRRPRPLSHARRG
jgi:rod shape-determining protein MreD